MRCPKSAARLCSPNFDRCHTAGAKKAPFGCLALAEEAKRQLNADSPAIDNWELVEFNPPDIKLLDKLEFVKYFLPDTIQYIPVFRLVQVEYEDCYHPIHIL